MEQDYFDAVSLTASFYEGSALVGSVPITVTTPGAPESPAPGGAQLFAAATNQAFTSVVITQTAGDGSVAIAEPRYQLATASLGLTQTANPTQQSPTQNVTYTLTLTNAANANDAIGTVVTDLLPAGMNFQAETDPGSPWVVSTPAVGSTGTVTFTDSAPFAAGATATFTITAEVDPNLAAGTSLNNNVSATADNSAPAASNGSAPVEVLGTSLGITNTVSAAQAAPGDDITYTIGLTNTGNHNAYIPQVVDQLPAGVSFQSETDPGFPWIVLTPSVGSVGTVSFTYPFFLSPGATATFTITVQVNAGEPAGTFITNTATGQSLSSPTIVSPSATFLVSGPILPLSGHNFHIERDSANPALVDFDVDGFSFQQALSTIQQINLTGLPGDDNLTVDSSHGLVTAPINFNASTNGANTLELEQTNGPALTNDTVVVGAGSSPSQGQSIITDSSSNTQTISFYNLAPIFDSLPSPVLDITSAIPASLLNGSNAITYAEGDDTTSTPNPAWGVVTVDSFEPLNFTNKDSLVIDSGPGTDLIDLNNPHVPAGSTVGSHLAGITVNGDDPTTGDTLIVNGTTGADAIGYAASGPGAGTVTVTPPSGPALPTVTLSGMGTLAINGQGGGDALSVTSPNGGQVTLTPGSSVDSGSIAITTGGAPPVSFAPLNFSGLGAAASSSLTISGPATLIYDGTATADTIVVSGSTVAGEGEISLENSASPPVAQVPVTTVGVTNLVLNGVSGNATFDVTATTLRPLPYTAGIVLEGGASGSPVANLTGDGTAATLILGGPSTSVTNGGLHSVTMSGLGLINLANGSGALDVLGTIGQTDDLAVTPTGTSTASIQDNGTGPWLAVSTTGLLTVSGNAGDSDTVTVNGTAGNDAIVVAGSATNPTVTVNSLMPIVVDAADTSALVIASGKGTDTVTVNSTAGAVTIPVTYEGGPTDTLALSGGTATSDTYTPGPVAGTGVSTLVFPGPLTENVYFSNIAPVIDTVTAPTLTVNGSASNDTINYSEASAATLGLVTVNNFEPITFSNKGTLDINGGTGDDTITVNNTNTPTGLTAINVNGGAGDVTLVVNANDFLVSSADVTATAIDIPSATPVAVGYSVIAQISIINSKDALTGTAASPISAVANSALNGIPVAIFQFSDQPPAELGSASDFLASIDWGDSTPSTAGTIIESAPSAAGVVTFEVLGSHTYLSQGSFSLSVSIFDKGSSRTFMPAGGSALTTITANPGATTTVTAVTASVASAPLVATGAPTNQVEGIGSSSIVATFVDPNPGASVANYPSGSISINWGDGTADTDTSPPIVVTQVGTQPNGVVFEVSAPHTYRVAGNFTVVVTITRSTVIGVTPTPGSSAVAISNEIVADAPLSPVSVQPTITTDEATTYPTPEFGAAPSDNPAQLVSGPVAYFTDANTLAPTTPPSAVSQEYLATIDWGDSTSQSTGTVTYDAAAGYYVVTGTHAYATSGVNGGVGHYAVSVHISDAVPIGSASSISPFQLTIINTANVTDNPIAVTGILNPATDTGKSNLDEITKDAQPNFYGTVFATLPGGAQVTETYAHVTLFANGIAVGTTQAGGDGTWSITSNLLVQGTYTITASATDEFGQTVAPTAVIVPTLVVDTQAPAITSLIFDRFDATLTVTFQDNLSGMDLASITNSAFYHISATTLVNYVHVPKLILPTSISYTPGSAPDDPVVVNVVFNKGKTFRGGKYEVVINSGTGDTGIQDVAGNALDGNFYGTFPTGDGLPGGNFVAAILTFHNKVLPYIPIADGYVPPPKGIDPPAGSSHAGKAQKTAHIKTKVVVDRSTARAAVVAQKANSKLNDEALRELFAESEARRVKK
jgi:uncharacterized repeat protein (TIGR01451 family)